MFLFVVLLGCITQVQLRRFFSWPDAFVEFDKEWTAAYEVGKALFTALGEWGPDMEPQVARGSEEAPIEDLAKEALVDKDESVKHLSGRAALAELRKHTKIRCKLLSSYWVTGCFRNAPG